MNNEPQDPNDTTPAGAENSGEEDQEKTVPYERFKQVIAERNELRAYREKIEKEREEREKEEREAEERRLQEQQEWENLAKLRADEVTNLTNQVSDLTQKVEAYEKALKDYLEAQKEIIPETIKDLLDRLPLAEQIEYLAEHLADIQKDQLKGSAPKPKKTTPQPSLGPRRPLTL